MKKSKLKLFPLMLMLVAGSIASIMTYYFQYEVKAALLIVVSVLLIFYLLGLIFIKVIRHFDQVNEVKRLAEEEAAENAQGLEEMEENLRMERGDMDEDEETSEMIS